MTRSLKPDSAVDAVGTSRPAFAVVICAFTERRWQWLLEAIDSVVAQTSPTAEIIVVIDHNERLRERLQTAVTGVRVVANAEARGLSGARNTGARTATADLVAFLDDDAAAFPDWLENLGSPYSMTDVVGVGGRIEPRWATDRPRWWPPEFDWVVGCTYRGMPDVGSDVRNPLGANMSFRRSAILDAGGFDTGTGRGRGRPLGGEETELAIRIAHLVPGARIRYEPAARVIHNVPAARSTLRYFVERCYAEGLSKARVARLSGRTDGLASERTYATRTIPSAAFREVGAAIRDRETARLRCAAALLLGVLVTTAGYGIGVARKA
jgi:glycosyltransferase involved in cell wall biosynthesis